MSLLDELCEFEYLVSGSKGSDPPQAELSGIDAQLFVAQLQTQDLEPLKGRLDEVSDGSK